MSIIEDTIGNFGNYQFILYIMIFFICLPLKFHLLASWFLSPSVSYDCEMDSGNGIILLVSDACPCENPIFDKSVFKETITTEWKLICSYAWMTEVAHWIFEIGVFIGNILFGILADRWGRRIPLTTAVFLLPFAGIIPAFVRGFWTFNVLRFLLGVFVGGATVTAYVLLTEFVGITMRDMATVLFYLPFSTGHILLPSIGKFTRNFRYFQLVISSFSLICLVYVFFLPESPMWLLGCNKIDEATKCLETVAKMNKMETANIRHKVEVYMNYRQPHLMPRGNLLALLRTKIIRKNILLMSYNCFTSSFCAYGVYQYLGVVYGRCIFSSVAISGALSLLATFIVFPVLKYFQRKPALVCYHVLSGVSILCSPLCSITEVRLFLCSVLIVTSTMSIIHEFLFTIELFPTVIRSIAMGCPTMTAKVGLMIVPTVVNLAEYYEYLPPILFGGVSLTAALSVFALNESKNVPLMTTIEEAEEFWSHLPTDTHIGEDN